MTYSGKGDVKKRVKDSEDGLNDSQSKKRFVWPEYLHREFISAVFDVGLNLVNSKELTALLSKDISPDLIRSHIQKFRSFRRRSPGRFSEGSNSNLASLNAHHYYLENNRTIPAAPIPSNSSVHGSNNGLLDDNLSLVASDDYRNIYDIDAAGGDPTNAISESEIAAQVLTLSSEIAAVDSVISSQTTYIQSLSLAVVQQMKLYTALVDTLMQIDPQRAAEHIGSPSYLNSNRQQASNSGISGYGSGSAVMGAGSFEGYPLRGSGSHSNLMYNNGQQQQQAQQQQQLHSQHQQQHGVSAGSGIGAGLPRGFPSQDSLANVSSEQIISSMRHAISSPFHSRSSNEGDPQHQHQHHQLHQQQQQQQQFAAPSFSGSGVVGSQARSEFSAIFEMRAQMDLHRKLFERKEDQLVGHYFYDATAATAATAAVSAGGAVNTMHHHQQQQQQQQQLQQMYGGGSNPPSPRVCGGGGGGGGGGAFFGMNQQQAQQQQSQQPRMPYVTSVNSFTGESYSYSVQPTAQQIQQQQHQAQQAHMMRLISSQHQQQQQHQQVMGGGVQYTLADLQHQNHRDNGGSSSSGSSSSSTRAYTAAIHDATGTSSYQPQMVNGNSGGGSSGTNSGSYNLSIGAHAVADHTAIKEEGASAASAPGANSGTWEDGGEFEADLFSFLINNSPERSEVS